MNNSQNTKRKLISRKLVDISNEPNTKCKLCGQPATHIGEPDPFASEINGDFTLTDLCDECYQNRCEDI